MTYALSSTNDRIRSGLAAIAVQALIVYALIIGLAVHVVALPDGVAKVFTVVPTPPPARLRPPPQHIERAAQIAAPSPPNLRSSATPVVAPTPIVRLDIPSPIVTAPDPAPGADATSGAAEIAGSGTGSGGFGNGPGGGGDGTGDETAPQWRRGDLTDADFPASVLARADDFHGTVSVRYLVATTGRVTQCGITRSSGNRDVDATTCRLIEKRFRFDPSRDAAGRPVPAMIVENHTWDIEHDRPAPRS